jgi:hypothetical protein
MPNPMADGDKPTQSRSQKPTVPKRSAERVPQKPAPKKQTLGRSSEKDKSIGNGTQVVITEDEYRALVAQKSYEIFMQRCAITEVDDWVQAERIVKEELLAQGQTAGFV